MAYCTSNVTFLKLPRATEGVLEGGKEKDDGQDNPYPKNQNLIRDITASYKSWSGNSKINNFSKIIM